MSPPTPQTHLLVIAREQQTWDIESWKSCSQKRIKCNLDSPDGAIVHQSLAGRCQSTCFLCSTMKVAASWSGVLFTSVEWWRFRLCRSVNLSFCSNSSRQIAALFWTFPLFKSYWERWGMAGKDGCRFRQIIFTTFPTSLLDTLT